MQGFDCLFRGLMRCETCPLVASIRLGRSGLLKVSNRLGQPVSRSIGQENLLLTERSPRYPALYIALIKSPNFSFTDLRLTFMVGVTSPSSSYNFFGTMVNFFSVST